MIAAALGVLAVACGSGAAQTPLPTGTLTVETTPEPTPLPQMRYETIASPYDVPLGRLVECGYLTVPENRSDPDSRNIRLAVAVVQSDSPNPKPDPIVYLSGGPGGSALKMAPFAFEGMFSPFVAGRDLILFDQRGVGHSEPALDCEESNAAYRKAVEQDIKRQELAAMMTEAIDTCHDRLARRGIDLSAYTSAESAADLNDLRQALGYEQWNLFGISYGTRLALTAMRDYPEGIRSVILDSTYPPQVDLYSELLPNARRAFDEFFGGCRADPVCSTAYPDLETVFFDLVKQLDAQPAALSVWNPATDVTIEAQMNGDLLLGALFQALYSTWTIPYLPATIYEASEGDLEVLTPLLGDLFFTRDFISIEMHYSVQCQEEVPFSSPERVAAAAQAHPRIRAMFDSEATFDICQSWGAVQPDPKENQPVRSDIPTLVLAGEYDPITPPSWGRLAAKNLPRGFFFEFPGVGHGASVSGEPCPLGIALAFLNAPTASPDASCIDGMTGPYFY